ncbi:hypothetical protein CALCODRAFT_511302 [Calocera cornea HHB12733]|uniref:Uncharacterized protein n=1 Tax=Calocera cornea HHB12733 TaxID=1353952 RepID=A0A165DUU6_9BASI|nr:hypothetical protein CALCODRAFT_511302 [Calocera cornea HHB12733]
MFDDLRGFIEARFRGKVNLSNGNFQQGETSQGPEHQLRGLEGSPSESNDAVWDQLSGLYLGIEQARLVGNEAYEAAVLQCPLFVRGLWAPPEDPRLSPELPFEGLLQHPLLASLYALMFTPDDTSDFLTGNTRLSVIREMSYIATLLAAAANSEVPNTEMAIERDENNLYLHFYRDVIETLQRGSMQETTHLMSIWSVEVGLRMRLMSQAEGLD